MENSQIIQIAPTVKLSRHGKHKNPNYQREYYLKNREKLLNYSRDYYGVKKKSFTGVRNIALPNKHKEVFFWWGSKIGKQFEWTGKKRTRREILEESVDKELIRLATKLTKVSKCQPLKKGWTYSKFKEWLSKERLLELYQQWSIRSGTRIGKKFLSFLDVDIEQEKFPVWLRKQLRKKVLWLLKRVRVCYVETKRGFHIPILSDELLPNEMLYHIDSWKKVRRTIGSIQSKGKFVIGFDSPDKVLAANSGKCFWQVKSQVDLKETLAKFFLLVGKTETKAIRIEKLTRRVSSEQQLPFQFKFSAQVKILSICRKFINRLGETMRRINYSSNLTGRKSYFLLNTYQKPRALEKMPPGKVLNLGLIQGNKHSFFSRIV